MTDNKVTFDIPQQRADLALTQFAEQADLTLVFPPEMLGQISANALIGTYTQEEGAKILLAGTGLNPMFSNHVVMSIAIDEKSTNKGEDMTVTKKVGVLGALAAVFSGAHAQEPANTPDVSENEKAELEEIEVIGSRISGYATSKPTITVDADQIERAGYASLDDVFRALPSGFSGYSQENTFGENGLVTLGPGSASTQFGEQSVLSLGALGPGTTLVLLDGRRLPSSARAGGSFTDVSGIPISMVERIEVLPAGSAALYGSDAIAGVINIILRKDAKGGEISAEYRDSSHGAHYEELTGNFTKGWDSGKVTISARYSDYKGAQSRKIWDDRPAELIGDWRDLGGTNFRSVRSVQPGQIFFDDIPGFLLENALPAFLIPAAQNGTNLQISDLVPFTGTLEDLPTGLLQPSRNTAPTESWSANIFFDQELGNKYQLFGSVLYSELTVPRNDIQGPYFNFANIPVPSSNPYSPFNDASADPRTIYVRYSPFAEERSGALLGVNDPEATSTQLGYSAGINGPLPILKGWDFDAQYNYGRQERCCNFVAAPLFGQHFLTANQAGLDQNGNPIPDSQILNLFGDGSTNTAEVFEAADFRESELPSVSDLHHVTIELSGGVKKLPGGEVQVSVLGEFIDEEIFSRSFPKPEGVTRQTSAISTQFFVPIIGEDNRRTGFQSLVLDGALRYEEKQSAGRVVSGFSSVLPSFSTTEERLADLDSQVFNSELGISWSLFDNLTLRGGWSTAFLQPSFEQTLSGVSTTDIPGFFVGIDPTARVVTIAGGSGNTSLEEQSSDTWVFGVSYSPHFIENLTLSANWSHTHIDNYIASPISFGNVFSFITFPEVFPEFVTVTQGAAGPIITFDAGNTNFVGRDSERVDFELSYIANTNIGDWDVGLRLSHALESSFTLREGLTADFIATDKGPAKWRGLGYVSWENDGLTITTTINYDHGLTALLASSRSSEIVPGFSDLSELVEVDVKRVVTVDLDVNYEFSSRAGSLEGVSLRLGVIDIFDEDLQFLDNRLGYNNITGNVDGRQIRFGVKKRF